MVSPTGATQTPSGHWQGQRILALPSHCRPWVREASHLIAGILHQMSPLTETVPPAHCPGHNTPLEIA